MAEDKDIPLSKRIARRAYIVGIKYSGATDEVKRSKLSFALGLINQAALQLTLGNKDSAVRLLQIAERYIR